VFLFLNGFRKLSMDHTIKQNQIAIVISCIVYGGLIELYQGFILTNRVADWTDFIANAIGTFIGWALYRYSPIKQKST